MDQFPLLRLPFVAFHEVLKTMTPFELINVSKATSKSFKMIEKFLKTKKISKNFKVNLNFCLKPKISIISSSKDFDFVFTSDKTENLSITKNDCKQIEKYSEDVVEEFRRMTEYVLNVFHSRIDKITFDLEVFPERRQAIIDFLKSKQCSICRGEIKGSEPNDEAVSYLLKSLNFYDWLYLHVEVTDSLRLIIPNVRLQQFIKNGNWIDLPRLLQFSSVILQIRRSKLRNSDINSFIRSWTRNESNMGLLFAEIYVEDLNLEEIVENVHCEVVDPDVVREFWCQYAKQVTGGIDIRRIDGLKATLYTTEDFGIARFKMIVHWVLE